MRIVNMELALYKAAKALPSEHESHFSWGIGLSISFYVQCIGTRLEVENLTREPSQDTDANKIPMTIRESMGVSQEQLTQDE